MQGLYKRNGSSWCYIPVQGMEAVGVTYRYKEWKLLVLHTGTCTIQSRHPISVADVNLCCGHKKMSKFNIQNIYQSCTKTGGAHFQYVWNWFARFE